MDAAYRTIFEQMKREPVMVPLKRIGDSCQNEKEVSWFVLVTLNEREPVTVPLKRRWSLNQLNCG